MENRIKEHEAYYETINDVSMPFVKLINVGEHLVVNRVQGYLQVREEKMARGHMSTHCLTKKNRIYQQLHYSRVSFIT